MLSLDVLAPEAVQSREISDYELLGEVARGGMGVVYRARHRGLNRPTALKRISAGKLASSSELQRFFTEARAAARLEHPNIVRVHDIGEDLEGPYLAMEWLSGGTLSQRIGVLNLQAPGEPLQRAQEAARIVAKVARAVQFAHDRGVLHRDLKPGNILFDEAGEPHVADFGLAKISDDHPELTATRVLAGTPHYLAPELIQNGVANATVAADVYSLGAIFYEVVTGRPPIEGRTAMEVMRSAVEDDPAPPSEKIRSANPGRDGVRALKDLDTIALHCLAKAPAQRYLSASAFAEDLERWLRGDPILVSPPSEYQRFATWCRRNPRLVASCLIVALSAVAGTSGIAWQWRRATRSEETMRLNLYAADIFAASRALRNGDLAETRRLLAAQVPTRGQEDIRGFEWNLLSRESAASPSKVFGRHDYIVSQLAISADGNRIASVGFDRKIKLWDAHTKSPLSQWTGHDGTIWSVAFSPDGSQLLTGSEDGAVKLWSLKDRSLVHTFPGITGVFSHDGARIITCESRPIDWDAPGKIRIGSARNGSVLRELSIQGKCIALSPDDTRLAITLADRGVQLWDLEGDRTLRLLPTDDLVWAPCFDSSGTRLAGAGRERAWIWDLRRELPPVMIQGHRLNIRSTTFSPDGSQLVTTGSDRTVRFWDTIRATPLRVLLGHENEVWSAVFSADGQELFTCGKDSTIRQWPSTPPENGVSLPHTGWIRPAFSEDGANMATSEDSTDSPEQRRAYVWQLPEATLAAEVSGLIPLGFDASSHQLVGWRGRVAELEWWPAKATHAAKRLRLETGADALYRYGLELSLPGTHCLVAKQSGEVMLFETTHGKKIGSLRVPPTTFPRPLSISRKGEKALFAMETRSIAWLLDFGNHRIVELRGHHDTVSAATFSTDDRRIATASADGLIKLWDAEDGHPIAELAGHIQDPTDVCFAPDGRTLASIGFGDCVKLWNIPTLHEVASVDVPNANSMLRFSPDGRFLAITLGKSQPTHIRLLQAW